MLGSARSSLRMMRPLAIVLASALSVSLAIPLFSADLRLDYQPAAYAIKGAKVVPVAGDPIESGTVVVRDGVIAAVGPVDRVEIPFDAEVIDGKGMVVYPGFLDLYTTSGQEAGAVKSLTGAGRTVNYADFALPRTPVDNRNGITPEYEVAKALDMPRPWQRSVGSSASPTSWSPPAASIATGQSALLEHQRPAQARVDPQGAGRPPHRTEEPRRRLRRRR